MDEFEKFIAWDSIKYMETYFKSNHFRKTIQTNYEHLSNFQTLCPSYCLSKASYLLFRNNKRLKNVIISSSKYPNLVDKFSQKYNWSIIDHPFFSVKKKIPSIYTINAAKCISNYYRNGDIQYLYSGIEICKKTLDTIKPDCVIFPQDSFPLERMIICACREMGVPTINIQDGIYQLTAPPLHGKATDYIFVWGNLFKEYYVDNNVQNADNIFVIGYPYELNEQSIAPSDSDRKKVYYLGQNFEKFNPDLLNYKLETLNALNNALKKLDVQFIYRPHPRDDIKSFKNFDDNLIISPKSESLMDTLNEGDIFISFNSTSLVEASMLCKPTIQLLNYPDLQSDNFEKLGVCSKTVDSINEVENYVKHLSNSPINKLNFNQDYIAYEMNTWKNISEYLAQILN